MPAVFLWADPREMPNKFDALKSFVEKPVAEKKKKPYGKSPKIVAKMREIADKARNASTLGEVTALYDAFTGQSCALKKRGNAHLLHSKTEALAMLGFIGFASEAGECLDEYKKIMFHDNTPVGEMTTARADKLIAELGDVEWYRSVLLQALGLDRRAIMQANMDKLVAREEGR